MSDLERHDFHKCESLLTGGHWLDTRCENWQPPGCMLHNYKASDVTTCLKSHRLVFAGDSLTRQIFWAVAKKLGIVEQTEGQHSSLNLEVRGITLQFLWDPFLNSSNLLSERSEKPDWLLWDDGDTDPAIVLYGGGLWYTRYMGVEYFERYKHSIEGVSQVITQYDLRKSHRLRSGSDPGPRKNESLMLMAPISTPVYDSLSPVRAHSLTPARIESMDAYLKLLPDTRKLPIVWSFASMASSTRCHQSDGLHFLDSAASRMADILLNIKCNAVLREKGSKTYPMDKTCCNDYGRPNWIQKAFVKGSLGLLPLVAWMIRRNPERLDFLPSRKIAKSITILVMTLCYCYYADRTPLFNKSQKQYNSSEFTILCLATAILGIFSTRPSVARHVSAKSIFPHPASAEQHFLSRDQTDEWKGWMQFLILIYHYAGASRILWIYKIIRLLVASYLFMSGFGHAVFFLTRKDYSLRRSAAVLIRINMLSCILPYIMKTDYLFYYFAPLVSFWYVVIYSTMAFAGRRNENVTFMVAKIFISAILTTGLMKIPGILEIIFALLYKCCKINWDVKEWRFRLQLDAYIVYAGMLCGLFFVKSNNVLNLEGDGKLIAKNSIWRILHSHRRSIYCLQALIMAATFFYYASGAQDKQTYNQWLPYTSAFPIVAFVILRNFGCETRKYYSSIFAWMGQHSLETFTLQFHIWLAADTKGLLALGVFEPVLGVKAGRRADFVVLSLVFIWVCWHAAAAIQTLTSWIVHPSEGRNELDAENDIKETLPRNRSEDNKKLSSLRHAANRIRAGVAESTSRLKSLVAGDLRIRCAILVGALWLLNVVS